MNGLNIDTLFNQTKRIIEIETEEKRETKRQRTNENDNEIEKRIEYLEKWNAYLYQQINDLHDKIQQLSEKKTFKSRKIEIIQKYSKLLDINFEYLYKHYTNRYKKCICNNKDSCKYKNKCDFAHSFEELELCYKMHKEINDLEEQN